MVQFHAQNVDVSVCEEVEEIDGEKNTSKKSRVAAPVNITDGTNEVEDFNEATFVMKLKKKKKGKIIAQEDDALPSSVVDIEAALSFVKLPTAKVSFNLHITFTNPLPFTNHSLRILFFFVARNGH